MWMYIIFALLAMLISSGGKKPTAKAAAVGVAAGLGAYYVGTQTEWGRSTVSSIEGALGSGTSSATATPTDGSTPTVTVPVSSTGTALAGLGTAATSLVPLAAAATVGAVAAKSINWTVVGGIAAAGGLLYLLTRKSSKEGQNASD